MLDRTLTTPNIQHSLTISMHVGLSWLNMWHFYGSSYNPASIEFCMSHTYVSNYLYL